MTGDTFIFRTWINMHPEINKNIRNWLSNNVDDVEVESKSKQIIYDDIRKKYNHISKMGKNMCPLLF